MLHISHHFQRFHIAGLVALVSIAVCVGAFDSVRAQQRGQKTFASSEEACAALIGAVQQEGENALVEILGPTAKEIISGGDEIEDRNSRRQFVEKYRQVHRLVREPDGTITLYVGAENWPLPIILMHKANRWYFDPVASKAEILFRRIGRNELETIEVCRELASRGDYAVEITKARPFHGYYYRILKSQGRHAPGGAKNYMVSSRMTGGIAFLAYPAEYRSSGVMTFIVNQNGAVYQKDLGRRTANRAGAITHYAPDATWKKVE